MNKRDGTEVWVKSAGGKFQSVQITNPELEAERKKLEAHAQAHANITSKTPATGSQGSQSGNTSSKMEEEKKTSDKPVEKKSTNSSQRYYLSLKQTLIL